jgi:hypothetical protein
MRYCLLIGLFLAVFWSLAGCGGGSTPVTPPVSFARLTIADREVLSSPPVYAYDAQVAVNPLTGGIFCCWVRELGEAPEIVWRHGLPGAFLVEEAITEVDGEHSWNPSIAAGPDGKVHFAWMDMKDGYKETHAKTWTGGAWGPEALLSLDDGWSGWDPDMEAFPDGRPVVAWFDHRFNVQHEILMRIGDGSGSWGGDIRLTNDTFWQYVPDIEIGPGDIVHLSYVDAREQDRTGSAIPGEPDHHQPGSNIEIYYRTWSPSGLGPEVRITDTPERSDQSQLAVDDSGKAHLVWLDETESGYFQLYYTSIYNNHPGPTIAVSAPGRRSDLSSITCLGNRTFIAYPEYPDPESEAYAESDLYVREVLSNGSVSLPLVIADSGTNLHPRMVSDPGRGMIWIIWMEYFGDHPALVTGESTIRLCGIEVRD